MISKTARIQKIEESFKFEGYCYIKTVDGKDHKRKVYPRKTGKMAGLNLVNLDTDIYSFTWTGEKPHRYAVNLQYVGNYKSIEDAVKAQESEGNIEVIEEPKVEVIAVDENGEVKHAKYNQIKICVENNVPVFLVGPAGSGKNHTLEQIAWELGLEFHFSNSIQQEYKLTGFIDAGGVYHESEFYKACREGADGKESLFFLDEMDASIPEVLVLLNMAIANGYFEFPNGKLNFGKKVKFVAAGNTVGNGADEQYTGRLVLDQATLDRFAIIDFDYDEKIELHLSKNNKDLVNFIRDLRKQAKDKGVRATFSYRCITMVTKLEGKLKIEDIMIMAIFKGMDKDTINTFRPHPMNSDKYSMALRRVQG
ncbi:MAG: AAA family ATPase [Clostridia bacterium]|nr:AAA family ATPase [Clostridia bacterium]